MLSWSFTDQDPVLLAAQACVTSGKGDTLRYLNSRSCSVLLDSVKADVAKDSI